MPSADLEAKRANDRQYAAAHRAEKKVYDAKRRIDNREERLAQNRANYAIPEKRARILEDCRRYSSTPAGKAAASRSGARYRKTAAGKENARLRLARHRATPKAKATRKAREATSRAKVKKALVAHARRARELNALGSTTANELAMKKRQFNYRCIDCNMKEGENFRNGKAMILTVGHAVPLIAGGSNFVGNIIPQCGPCNSRQGTSIHSSVTRFSLFDKQI